MGHEFIRVVEEVGSDVRSSVKPEPATGEPAMRVGASLEVTVIELTRS